MIHLQQKGTPVEEIAYGLCLAIARNALATLLKGRDAAPPVVLAGGAAPATPGSRPRLWRGPRRSATRLA